VVDRAFSQPGHDVELLVGRWLAHFPNNRPTDAQAREFMASLPPDAADVVGDLEGLRSIIKDVDAEAVSELREPDTMSFLATELGWQQAIACVAAIRRMVLARVARLLFRHG
jgi:hypothetical protein